LGFVAVEEATKFRKITVKNESALGMHVSGSLLKLKPNDAEWQLRQSNSSSEVERIRGCPCEELQRKRSRRMQLLGQCDDERQSNRPFSDFSGQRLPPPASTLAGSLSRSFQ
jgi:hypothetical protein